MTPYIQRESIHPAPTDHEPAWSRWLADRMGGVAEFRCFEKSRVDIVTETHAWEVEWIKKWKEAPAQALLYSSLTGKKPGVILLSRDKPTEEIYYMRALMVCERASIDVLVQPTRLQAYTRIPAALQMRLPLQRN